MASFCRTFLITICISICIATSPIYKPPPQDSVTLNAKDFKKAPHESRYLHSTGKNQEPKPMETSIPNNEDLEALAEEVLEPSASGLAFPLNGGTARDDLDDDMETAENIVFRPLFRYKKQNVERRTVYRDKNGNISNQPQSPSKPQPAAQKPPKNPPPILVFDKVTGSYYPASSQYSSYYPGAYPAYFRGTS